MDTRATRHVRARARGQWGKETERRDFFLYSSVFSPLQDSKSTLFRLAHHPDRIWTHPRRDHGFSVVIFNQNRLKKAQKPGGLWWSVCSTVWRIYVLFLFQNNNKPFTHRDVSGFFSSSWTPRRFPQGHKSACWDNIVVIYDSRSCGREREHRARPGLYCLSQALFCGKKTKQTLHQLLKRKKHGHNSKGKL